jgi:hypothetical protein
MKDKTRCMNEPSNLAALACQLIRGAAYLLKQMPVQASEDMVGRESFLYDLRAISRYCDAVAAELDRTITQES